MCQTLFVHYLFIEKKYRYEHPKEEIPKEMADTELFQTYMNVTFKLKTDWTCNYLLERILHFVTRLLAKN